MTRMQVRRNTDFTGWPSTEGQTGSQHALEGKTMDIKARKAKAAQMISAAGWSVERIDFRRNVIRIGNAGKTAFVTLWRGMTDEMLASQSP
ncbi:TPA: hypothetical protein NJF72_001073 [Pseudomonas aeruginosa]|nr:hypothetical protein [Pseudomonas aeruginosa]HBN8186026.1 hypothetical protein [Pseudomonas aeruginosa]HCG0872576.1 hypothetical protein [Pseudomonas aeruginosa]